MKKAIFHIRDKEIVNTYAVKNAFALPDGVYELKITKKSKRSLNQNNYYWGCIVPMIQEGMKDIGYDVSKEETHAFLKNRFNAKEFVDEQSGEIMSFPQSTADMNKEQFGEYIDRIQRFASEYLNIQIPNPNEQVMLSYE
jgi:hypothetical protein